MKLLPRKPFRPREMHLSPNTLEMTNHFKAQFKCRQDALDKFNQPNVSFKTVP